jgi:hypothetical protein
VVGAIGGGKARPTGKVDIAVMQSLSRQGEVKTLVEDYGQVIVDECHHFGAVSFDAILKRTKAKYVLGLTATPTASGRNANSAKSAKFAPTQWLNCDCSERNERYRVPAQSPVFCVAIIATTRTLCATMGSSDRKGSSHV